MTDSNNIITVDVYERGCCVYGIKKQLLQFVYDNGKIYI